jgi:hypothetical protein
MNRCPLASNSEFRIRTRTAAHLTVLLGALHGHVPGTGELPRPRRGRRHCRSHQRRGDASPGPRGADKGEKSEFIDALIVDTANIAPLSTEPTFKIFAAKAVVGAIEITSAPKAKVPCKGIAKVRQIAKIRKYADLEYELLPRCFLITSRDEWSHWENYRKHLMAGIETARQHGKAVWVNATWSVRYGMFRFRPHETGQIPTRVHENALLEFIFFIDTGISSVRTDLIDVTRYRPSARRDVEPAPEGTRGSGPIERDSRMFAGAACSPPLTKH